jgi:hypothetical protein
VKTLVVDAKQRVRLPDFKPQQVVAYEFDGHGAATLTRVEPIKGRKAKLIRRGGRTLLQTPSPISEEDVKRTLLDFP